MDIIKVGSLVILFISILLKLLYVFYNRAISSNGGKKTQDKNIDLLDSKVSYEQFERISKETLVHNSPVRMQGDFVDFLIENLPLSKKGIESRVLRIGYGEQYDR